SPFMDQSVQHTPSRLLAAHRYRNDTRLFPSWNPPEQSVKLLHGVSLLPSWAAEVGNPQQDTPPFFSRPYTTSENSSVDAGSARVTCAELTSRPRRYEATSRLFAPQRFSEAMTRVSWV